MANDQKDPRFGENQPGQEKKQGAQNPEMKKNDLNQPSDADRGLSQKGQQMPEARKQGQQPDPYTERSHSGRMYDKKDDLNSPSKTDDPNEPYARERSTSPAAQGEPRREDERPQKDDRNLTEIPHREEERKIKTPSGEQDKFNPTSKTDDPTKMPPKPDQNKPDSKGTSSWEQKS